MISTKSRLAEIQARTMQFSRELRAENQKWMGISPWQTLGCPTPDHLTFEVGRRNSTAAGSVKGLDEGCQDFF